MKCKSPRRRSLRWRNCRVQKTVVTVTFLFVPLLLLLLFTYLPFGRMIQFSFYDMGYIGKRTWVGLENYADLLKRRDILPALKNSLYYLVGALAQTALALLFAVLLTQKRKGRNFFRAALFFPSLVGGIAVGFIFRYFYTHGMVLDSVLMALGVPEASLPYWLRDTSVNNWALALASVWRYMGQNMVLFIGAIASVDTTQYEAAVIDGANRWQQFWYITLPSLRLVIGLNLLLSISGALSVFEIPYVITDGGFDTETYFVRMDKLSHVDQKVGLACAMAVALLLLIFLVAAIEQLIRKGVQRDGRQNRR